VLHQLALPSRDLIGMNVVLLSKFSQGLVATERLKRHFGLEHGGMVPTGSFHRHCSFQRQEQSRSSTCASVQKTEATSA